MSRRLNRTLTLVTPVFEDDDAEVAESMALLLLRQLRMDGVQTAIWTTTAGIDESTGAARFNRYEAGETESERLGMPVRRFSCFPFDSRVRRNLARRLERNGALAPEEESEFIRHGVWSPSMRRALHELRGHSLYLFSPLEASTTLTGLTAAPQESIIAPNIGSLRALSLTRAVDTIALCPRLVFFSEPESELLGQAIDLRDKITVVAGGVEYTDSEPPFGPGPPVPLPHPYILALGCQGRDEGTDRLIEYFRRLVGDSPLPWRLALAGPGSVRAPAASREFVTPLGPISHRKRWPLIGHAACVVVAAESESPPVSLFEGWVCGVPAAVNEHNPVAAAHARRSGGGLLFRSYEEFRLCLTALAREPRLSEELSAGGRAYVSRLFRWSDATGRMIAMLQETERWLDSVEIPEGASANAPRADRESPRDKKTFDTGS